MVELSFGNQSVKIDEGELVGYKVLDHEFMHRKGNPGWRSVDTEMFPIIGPTNEVNFKIETAKGTAIQDQHGLLREMKYSLKEASDNSAVFIKKYSANSLVSNAKYPNKSTAEKLSWPFDFEFVKSFELSDAGLEITFTISGEKGMPFMLGYHPAFQLHNTNATILAEEKEIAIADVIAAGSRAFQVPGVNTIVLKDKRSLQITTKGYNNFMLWTEVPNMVCIEPITFPPYSVEQKDLAKGFMYLDEEPRTFEVVLKPI